MKEEIDIQKELVILLDYYKYRLTSGGCTLPEMNSLGKILAQHMDIEGSSADFAKFYGVSEDSIRHILSRYMVEKPKRRVFYNFRSFSKLVPRKWLENK